MADAIEREEAEARESLGLLFASEHRRVLRSIAARTIQHHWHKYLVYRKYKELRHDVKDNRVEECVVMVQKLWRGRKVRRVVGRMRRELDMDDPVAVPRIQLAVHEKNGRLALFQEESKVRLARLWMNYVSLESVLHSKGLTDYIRTSLQDAFKNFTHTGVHSALPPLLVATDEEVRRQRIYAQSWRPYCTFLLVSETLSRTEAASRALLGMVEFHEASGREVLRATCYFMINTDGRALAMITTNKFVGERIKQFRALGTETQLEHCEVLRTLCLDLEACHRVQAAVDEEHERRIIAVVMDEQLGRTAIREKLALTQVQLIRTSEELFRSTVCWEGNVRYTRTHEVYHRTLLQLEACSKLPHWLETFEHYHRTCYAIQCAWEGGILMLVNSEGVQRHAVGVLCAQQTRGLVVLEETVARTGVANEEQRACLVLDEVKARDEVTVQEAQGYRGIMHAWEGVVRMDLVGSIQRQWALWTVEFDELVTRTTTYNAELLSLVDNLLQLTEYTQHAVRTGTCNMEEVDRLQIGERGARVILQHSYQDPGMAWNEYLRAERDTCDAECEQRRGALAHEEEAARRTLVDELTVLCTMLEQHVVPEGRVFANVDVALPLLGSVETLQRRIHAREEGTLRAELLTNFKSKTYSEKKQKNVRTRLLRAHRERYEQDTTEWVVRCEGKARMELVAAESDRRAEIVMPPLVITCQLPQLLALASEDGEYCHHILEAIGGLPLQDDTFVTASEASSRHCIEIEHAVHLVHWEEACTRRTTEGTQQAMRWQLKVAMFGHCEGLQRESLCRDEAVALQECMQGVSVSVVVITEVIERSGLAKDEARGMAQLSMALREETEVRERRAKASQMLRKVQKRNIAQARIEELRRHREESERRDEVLEKILLKQPVVVKKEAAYRMCLETEESTCRTQIARAMQSDGCILPPLKGRMVDTAAPRAPTSTPTLPALERPRSPFLLKEMLLNLRSLSTSERPVRKVISTKQGEAFKAIMRLFAASKPRPTKVAQKPPTAPTTPAQDKLPAMESIAKSQSAKSQSQWTTEGDLVAQEMRHRLEIDRKEYAARDDRLMRWKMQHAAICWHVNSTHYADIEADTAVLLDQHSWLKQQHLPYSHTPCILQPVKGLTVEEFKEIPDPYLKQYFYTRGALGKSFMLSEYRATHVPTIYRPYRPPALF
eukprot:TRINITY_DN7111_c0_g1_i2.p1 TRINITY_DN7111_c0_g1~~TRINITY_DN7111_c0_g1_i2.p1  ORF type:complete len:1179 (+),score=325.41 TRINITY_DN7111_c0_g1_i2:39-3575(+)